MLTIVAVIESTAEDIDALRPAFAEMEAASREEPGCVDYTFLQEVSNPDILRINERWESMDALAAHFATPHMARFNEAISSRPPKSMKLDLHELGERRELPGRS